MEVARRRTLLVAATVLSAALCWMVLAAPPSAAASNRRPAPAYADGLGIRPGKIKHVWLIILENKSYDATFTGLNNNTYLWQTLPRAGRAAQELLRHRALQPRQLHLAGQRPGDAARHPGRLPLLRPLLRSRRHVGLAADATPTTARWPRPQGPNAAAGANGCVYPASVPTLFNQLDAARRQLEGLRPGPRQPRSRAPPQHTAGIAVLRRAVRDARADRQHRPAQPRRRERDRPVRAQALPVPVVRVDPAAPATATPRTSPTCSTRADGLLPRPAERGDDARVQLDHAEQLQRRPRRRLPRQQPLRRLLRPEHAQRAASTTPAACTPPTCSSSTSSPRSSASPAFKDGGLIDITFDEAFPPFTYTGNSFANSNDRRRRTRPPRSPTTPPARRCSAAPSTSSRPGPNTPLAKDAQRQRAVPGPRRQRVHRPPEQLRRADGARSRRRAPACSAAARNVPGAAHRRRRHRAARAARRSPTTRSSRPTPAAR